MCLVSVCATVYDFRVFVRRTEASDRCRLTGDSVLRAESDALQLLDKTGEVVFMWPYKYLRRFGRDKVTRTFATWILCDWFWTLSSTLSSFLDLLLLRGRTKVWLWWGEFRVWNQRGQRPVPGCGNSHQPAEDHHPAETALVRGSRRPVEAEPATPAP